MDVIFTLAIIYFIFTLAAIVKWPELSLGVQLFGKPIFTMAMGKLGLPIGSAYLIIALTFVSFLAYQSKPRSQGIFRFTTIEIAMLLLLLWGIISLAFTPSPNYGYDKMFQMALIGIPCMISARIFTSTPENLRLTLQVLGWYAIVTLFIIIAFVFLVGSGSSGARLKSAYFGVLGLGYSAVAMTIFALFVAISGNYLSRGVALFSILYSSIVLIIGTGSRGPALALLTGVALTFLRGQQIIRTLAIGGVVTVLVYIVAINFASESGLARITGTDERESGAKSTDSRLYLYETGIDQFIQNPLIGQGSGSFSTFLSGRDAKQYPHNYVIEVAGELGLVGLILFAVAMFYCGSQLWRLRRYTSSGASFGFWEISLIQIMFFAGLLNAMFSFDMSKQRMFYVAIGLMAAVTQWNWQQQENNTRAVAADEPESEDNRFEKSPADVT